VGSSPISHPKTKTLPSRKGFSFLVVLCSVDHHQLAHHGA